VSGDAAWRKRGDKNGRTVLLVALLAAHLAAFWLLNGGARIRAEKPKPGERVSLRLIPAPPAEDRSTKASDVRRPSRPAAPRPREAPARASARSGPENDVPATPGSSPGEDAEAPADRGATEPAPLNL
jgi:hypothetical protein